MKRWAYRIGLALAVLFLLLTVINASWLAPAPRGAVKLIAHRGAHQLYDHHGLERDTCTATRIEVPVHDFQENTVAGLLQAQRLGAQMIEVDIAPTADGQIALFHDWTLDCRTDGQGPVRAATMAQLKALDATYGYSADGGKTFPFRGQGKGLIPTLAEAVAALPERPLIYNFKSKDAGEADLLAKALKAAGRDPEKVGDAFYGAAGPVARIRQLYPAAWSFSKESATACTIDYLKTGWFTVVPESCRNGTIIVPQNYQWAFAGWPNRLIQRMEGVGARVIVVAPHGKDRDQGLTLPEQLGDVPDSFRGYIWVEDIHTIGPALRPAYNKRNPREEAELARQLAARRKAQE
ncbi:glycerophosphodiester phosphodiesterase family protein [Novosphingobium sp. B 225]|uniref:glycerophosphodiester phosphodiesterase family protein n=1 Tax=Novosphingobium sp. B 225 TaxID=1961849 RepID=UPI000B4B3850|nr:glycerophosphodiester phosphodiesterase family protein [Novosphingobium sp. B 225]